MKEYIARRVSAVHVIDATGNEVPSDLLDSLGISLITNEPVSAPTLGPAIADRTYVVGSAPVTIDLSQRFLGAISYGMTPTNIPGVTRSGAIVTIDPATTRATTAITVSGTNTAGTATMTFNLTVNAVSPTVTAALPDRSLTVGDAAVVVALGDYFANAASYSVSPTGQGVSISGSTLTISAAAERNGTYTVTASNSTGQTVSDAFALVVAAVAAPLSRLALHIDADIDLTSGGSGERDDGSAMALWLSDQDNFRIVGLTASAPDSNIAAYEEAIAAYEADLPRLQTTMPDASVLATPASLRAMVTQGAVVDAPSAGYWVSGASGYAAPHAAAQRMIANALAHGDPTSTDPTRKLWVIIQGGYTTLAQAAYEAVQLGELPDFFDRIRIVGQPNYNSWWAPNAWNYLFSRMWPSAGTPGLFGNAWMLCGYLQWHGLNRDNGGTDATFWNETTARSATGAYLNSQRDGAYPTAHWRAGDAGAWLWLRSAKDQGNYSPANAANDCGVYRTYAGVNPWPSRTVGYGSAVQPQFPNPQGVTHSTTIWAPELTVDSFADARAAVDLDAWYSRVRQQMARYQQITVPAQVAQPSVSGTGTSRTITWTAPENGGSPITDYVITLNGAVVADGVGTGTTYTFTGLADASYSATVAAVNSIGTGQASAPRTFTVGSGAPALTMAFPINEGSGTAASSASGQTMALTGATWLAAPARLNFSGTGQYGRIPVANEDSLTDHILGILVRMDSVTGTRCLMTRHGALNSPTTRQFQFRCVDGALIYLAHPQTGTTAVSVTSAGACVAGEWAMFTAYATQTNAVVRKNGVQIASGTLGTANRDPALNGALVTVGARLFQSDGTFTDFFDGEVAGQVVRWQAVSGDISTVEDELRAIATSKGITIP